jgi:hypothetical protein
MHNDEEQIANVKAFIHQIKQMITAEQIPIEQKLAILRELLSIAQRYEEGK